MQCQFVDPASPAWSAVIREIPHDFYHRPDYAEICAAEEKDVLPRAFIARDDDGLFFLPMLVRPIETEFGSLPLFDAVTPYGYSAPLIQVKSGADPDRFLERAIPALIRELSHEGIIAVFARLHPLMPIPMAPLRNFGTVVEHGETVYVDLRRTREEILEDTHNQTRRFLRRVRADGFVAEVDPAWTCLEDFAEVYAQTMRRVNAAPEYFFSAEYFAAFRDRLGDCMHLAVVRKDKQVVMGAIFSELNSIVQYHLGGTRDGFEKINAPRLCMDFMRFWSKDRGNHFFHIGGGVGGRDDSVFRFKAQFSDARAVFHTWRLVIDPARYQALINNWELETGMTSAGPTGYFPEYRTPVPVGVC